MRTTVTLDADVAAEIERIRKTEGGRFKRVLNDTLRRGLRERAGDAGSARPSPTQPRDLGEALVDIASTSRALAFGEGEDHR